MKRKILLIEDNSLNSELATDLLEAQEFIVYQARTAEEGLQSAHAKKPDLIIMDISLPGMDGLCATRSLKTEPATKHIPIIALTSHAMKGDEEVALSSGCDGYMSKPINTKTFVAKVAAFLPATAGETKS